MEGTIRPPGRSAVVFPANRMSNRTKLSIFIGIWVVVVVGIWIVARGAKPIAIPEPTLPEPAPSTTPTEATTAAIVAFEPETLEFGELLPQVPASRTVRIRNLTATPLAVTEAITDCPCTSATVPDAPIAPGESAEVEVTIDPGERQGVSLGKKLAFLVEGHDPVSLRIEASVPLFVRASPEAIDAPADDVAEPAPTAISLEAVDGTAFTVSESDPPVIVVGSAGAGTRREFSIDWKAWREARRPIKVTVYTDHPKAPPIPLIVRKPLSRPSTAAESNP